MRIVRILLIPFFLISFAMNSKSEQDLDATIRVKSFQVNDEKIPKTIFGIFIEFINNFINGPAGLWAQELTNRGFDFDDKVVPGVSLHWNLHSKKNNSDLVQLVDGGYNNNGKYFQRITNQFSDSYTAISQKVYLYDTVTSNFYIYLKSETDDSQFKVSIYDTLINTELFTHVFNNISKDWKKYSVTIPAGLGKNLVYLSLGFEGIGIIDFDEASLMPSHNVNGIKKEYYDIFARWKPGIIRYPGGFFADTKNNLWKSTLNEIDQRVSPNSVVFSDFQRMDFGINEFLNFCKMINTEPHLVINMINDNPQSASDLSDYCNGDIDTYYGKLRIENGFLEPFNVKYWEIGNEQWENPPKMATDYLPFYHALKKSNTDNQVMLCGNIWGGLDYMLTVFDIVGENTDLYSYHEFMPAKPKVSTYSEEQRYYSTVASSKILDNLFGQLKNWIFLSNAPKNLKLAMTEYLLSFDIGPPHWDDSNVRNFSFEAGLWMAGSMNSFVRNHEFQPIFEKTFGLGHIRVGFDKNGKRIFYPSPTHTIMEFFRHHTGDYLLDTEVDCLTYSTELIDGLYQSANVPFLDVTTTANKDKLYISVLNRHISDSLSANIVLPLDFTGKNVKIYEFYDNDYFNYNTPDEPEKIKFSEVNTVFNHNYTFPPHSYTLFEFDENIDLELGINDTIINDSFAAFPNPASDVIKFVLPASKYEYFNLKVINLLGEVVIDKTISTTEFIANLSISSLIDGVYVVNLYDGNKNYYTKFSVAR
ncbi:hypothetical protein MASR1M45_16850 [Candidatus Kapaibacterium sp.]